MAADVFTQSRLQDYVDCPYRYWLRYVQRLESPSVQAEPVREYEQAIERGTEFHRLAQQYILGIPAAMLAQRIEDPRVKQWWTQFERDGLTGLPTRRFPEITLVTLLNGVPLAAKIDLLAIESGRVVIVDWKTSRKPSISTLQARLQTKVYRWVVSQAAGHILGSEIAPEHIEMQYWFAGDEQPAVKFSYSHDERAADERELQALIQRIQNDTEFVRTTDFNICRVCAYRSLSRPEQPPSAAHLIDDNDLFALEDAISDDL